MLWGHRQLGDRTVAQPAISWLAARYEALHRNATVVVRLVQHDGTGLTALEGLSMGRHVIYSYPLPHTIQVGWGETDALVEALSGLCDLHAQGSLRANTAGSAFVDRHLNHQVCVEELARYFTDLASSRREKGVSHG